MLSALTPEELVAQVDFTYIDDALSPAEALAILRAGQDSRPARIAALEAEGFPAYTTSAGWLGYDDEKVARLARQSVADGFTMIKLKVGTDLAADVRRLGVARVGGRGGGAHRPRRQPALGCGRRRSTGCAA